MLSSTTRKIQYGPGTGWAIDDEFAIDFKYWAKSEIVAVLSYDDGVTPDETLVLDTDYELTAPGDTGTLTSLTEWDADAVRLTIYREVSQEQETDYRDGEAVPANTIETNLDRLTAMVQELEESQGRSLRAPLTDEDTSIDMTIPPLAERVGGTLLGFDVTTGNPVVYAEPGSYPATTYMGALLNSVDGVEELRAALAVDRFERMDTTDTIDDGDGDRIITTTPGQALAGNITLTLPIAASNAGLRLRIQRFDTSESYSVTVSRQGSDVIGAAGTSVVLTYPYQWVVLWSDGVRWVIEACDSYIEVFDLSTVAVGVIVSYTWKTPTDALTLTVPPGVWAISAMFGYHFSNSAGAESCLIGLGIATSQNGTPGTSLKIWAPSWSSSYLKTYYGSAKFDEVRVVLAAGVTYYPVIYADQTPSAMGFTNGYRIRARRIG